MNMKYTALSVLILTLGLIANATNAMQPMTEEELSEAQGQALFMMSKTDASNGGKGTNPTDYQFYKVGMEAKMELNANIKSLQLGCGGVNGVGACDIDISNLSLSGPADGKQADGTPQWSTGRANTSALLTNPFIEFAIKNPDTAATREIVGFRLSAEEILGHMSAGVSNDRDNNTEKSTGGGINNFSGYLKVSETPVNAFTQQAIFGTRPDQAIAANIRVNTLFWNNRTAQSNINKMSPGKPGYEEPENNGNIYVHGGNRIWGIHIPRVDVVFDFPQTAVTGNRMSQLNLVVRDVPVGDNIGGAKRLAIGRDSGGINMALSSNVATVSTATFFMGANNNNGTYAACSTNFSSSNCSYIANLKANVTVKQNFNLVHNLPITSGGYLSLQSEKIRWPGTASAFVYNTNYNGTSIPKYEDVADNHIPTDLQVMNYGDIAQPGWWLSFKDPLDFGELNPTTGIPMDDVLPQIATYITDYLSNQDNRIDIGLGDALGALFGAPLYKGLGDIMMAPDARAVMVLENLQLDGHQNIVPNCWGNLKFC